MKAALLPDRGVVKVAGDDARNFLNGMLTADIGQVTPEEPRYAALLTPQGKIIADAIVTQAVGASGADGGGFFLDVPKALAKTLVDRLNFYRLRAKAMIEDLSATLGVLAVWDGGGGARYGHFYRDPRLPALGWRIMLSPHRAAEAAAVLGADQVPEAVYEVHRIALGVPRGGVDFGYGDAFPHEADMDQLHGVDFAKGCFVGQEVVSRMEHRGSVRTRIVSVAYEGSPPEAGAAVTAGERPVGTLGSSANGHALAMLRLDRAADAAAAGHQLRAGNVTLRLVKPAWARFPFPEEAGPQSA